MDLSASSVFFLSIIPGTELDRELSSVYASSGRMHFQMLKTDLG